MGFLDTVFGVVYVLTWGWALVPFLVVLGVFFSAASGFVQFRFFKRMFNVLKGDDENNDPNKISAREATGIVVPLSAKRTIVQPSFSSTETVRVGFSASQNFCAFVIRFTNTCPKRS